MKAPLFVLGLVTAALAMLALAVYAMDDETLFVSSPEMTANQLLVAISHGRLGAARATLSQDARRATSDQEMRRISQAFRARVGRVRSTTGEPWRRRGNTLLVRVSVSGERADPELLLRMVREQGAWSVIQPEDVLPVGGAVTSERR